MLFLCQMELLQPRIGCNIIFIR
uniref:Uncharacterized protein n=1 Tax=Arundo donax TaxID=35708 RepID=A0A0A8ZQR0_ARUDO